MNRKVAVIGVILFVAGVMGMLIYWQWNLCGMVSESEDMFMEHVSVKKKELALYVNNCTVIQGEKVMLNRLAGAEDEEGEDISHQIVYRDEDGQLLQGRLDTKKAGIRRLSVSVKSPKTGRLLQRKLLVLVDGRVQE